MTTAASTTPATTTPAHGAAAAHHGPSHKTIWIWLMVLMAASVVASFLKINHTVAEVIIFGAAFIKALLVTTYYMHLKVDRLLYTLLAVTPVLLFVILLVALLPDFVTAPWDADPAVVPAPAAAEAAPAHH